MAQPFLQYAPKVEDYWRGILLFGRNVATYKFALGRALLDIRPAAGQLIRLEDLAVPYSRFLCEHLRLADKQGTFQASRFLDACRSANEGQVTDEKLIDWTVRYGFNNVIDAFHMIGRDEIPRRFFTDERAVAGGIRMTDSFAELLGSNQAANLPEETEARWRLVETAWELGISRALISVSHDPVTEALFVVDAARRRKDVTGARFALSGYQKGHCFYCFGPLSAFEVVPPDVDHFFPHILKSYLGPIVDGVWNLVLACTKCNRGAKGKLDRVPTIKLLERLYARNEFLIASHHPLRETITRQTGASDTRRRVFLNDRHADALSLLIHQWQAQEISEPPF